MGQNSNAAWIPKLHTWRQGIGLEEGAEPMLVMGYIGYMGYMGYIGYVRYFINSLSRISCGIDPVSHRQLHGRLYRD